MTDDIIKVKRGDLEIWVYRNKCIGAAPCTVYAPETFDLDEDGIAKLKDGKWDDFETIVAAAKSCPVMAIEVYKNGKRIFPDD